MVETTGNDPASEVCHTPANPSQLRPHNMVEVTGIEPAFATCEATAYPSRLYPHWVLWFIGNSESYITLSNHRLKHKYERVEVKGIKPSNLLNVNQTLYQLSYTSKKNGASDPI